MDSENIKINVYLAEEIIEEILSRLPVKSLLRFRCVSKSWLSLISSQRVVEAHRQNSTKNRAFSHQKIIFDCDGYVFKQCSVQQLLNEPSSVEPSPIHHLMNNEIMRGGAYVVGCCNGLLCLSLYSRRGGLFLWNPTTKIFMELPNLKDLVFEKFGLGWDGRSGAYKVFALSNHWGIRKGNVYSSNTNSWKTVEARCPVFNDCVGMFACGKIHWVTRKEDYNYIESFDLRSEEFGKIELPLKTPKYHFGRHYKLAEIGGCLHLLCVHIDRHQQSYEAVAVVWVMKESGWLKLYTFPPVFVNRYFLIRPVFGGGPNGEIFLIIQDNFLVYDGKDGIVHPASDNIRYLRQGRIYVESFVSPNFTAAS